MKASIIYTVAVSVVLISTLAISLEKNSLGKIGNKRAIKMNPIFNSNESQNATVDFTKVQVAKTNSDDKKKSALVIAKPELVLEEMPSVFTLVSSTEKSWSFESAIIEENDSEETQTLVDIESNSVSPNEEAIELEILLIQEYGRRDLNLGLLVNHTNGGEGVVGAVLAEAQGQVDGEGQEYGGQRHC